MCIRDSQGTIKVALKYDSVNKVNAIKKLERVSSPGMRKYTGYKDMPRVINGLGIACLLYTSPSPNLRAILDFGPVYLAISFKYLIVYS